MDWPPQSPDLNPIENLWKTLGVKVMERNPTNTEDLRVKLQEEWSKISIEDCQELIRSCSRRCAAVIESKAHLLNIDCTCIFIVFWQLTLFFSILSLTFGRSKFEDKKIIVIILFLSFANDSYFSMLLWMITTTSCQNFSFSQLLFVTNIRF